MAVFLVGGCAWEGRLAMLHTATAARFAHHCASGLPGGVLYAGRARGQGTASWRECAAPIFTCSAASVAW